MLSQDANNMENFHCMPDGEQQQKLNSNIKYYIQNTNAGFIGNSIVFWALGSNGYTSKLDNAEKFDYEEAKKICQGNPEKNKAWSVDYIDSNKGTARVTDSQYLDDSNIIKF